MLSSFQRPETTLVRMPMKPTKAMKSHMEPDRDQKGGKSDRDADDRRKPPSLKGVKKGK